MSEGLPDFMYASALELSNVTVDVNITNTVIDVNITNPQIDVNVVNTSIDVRLIESTITLDVNITNTELNVNVTNTELSVNVVNPQIDIRIIDSTITLNVLAPSGDAVSVGTVKPIIEDLPIPGMAWEEITPGERRTFLDVTGRGKILSITLISRRKNTTLPPDFDFYLNIDGVDYCICAWSLRMMGGLVMESFTPRSGYSNAYKAVHVPKFGGMIEEFYDGSDTWICAIIEPNADFKSSLRIDYHNSNADDNHWVHMIVVYGFYP